MRPTTRSTRMSLFLLIAIMAAATAAQAASPVVFLTYEESDGYVYRLQDLNNDGDARDPGEAVQYAPFSDWVEGLAVDKVNGDVYFAEEGNNVVYRLRDLNHDGDAMDAGEKVLFADDNGRDCSGIEAVAYDESTGTLYTTFEDASCVVWHRDLNHDGDALDAGESGLLTNSGSDLESITTDSSTGKIYVGDNGESGDVVRVLTSAGVETSTIPGLGHEANDYDSVRHVLYSGVEDFSDVLRWAGSAVTTYATLPNEDASQGLAVDVGTGDVFVGGESGPVYRFHDANNDGDGMDAGEMTTYSDSLSEGEVDAMGVYPNQAVPVPAVSPLALLLMVAGLAIAGYVALR